MPRDLQLEAGREIARAAGIVCPVRERHGFGTGSKEVEACSRVGQRKRLCFQRCHVQDCTGVEFSQNHSYCEAEISIACAIC